MEISTIVGKNLKKARIKNGYSQLYVEMNSYLEQSQISRFETGKFEADYQTLVFLSKFYHVSMNEIFDLGEDF